MSNKANIKFSSETMEIRRQWIDISQVPKENNRKAWILYTYKYISKMKAKCEIRRLKRICCQQVHAKTSSQNTKGQIFYLNPNI